MSVSSPAGKHEALSKVSWLEVCKRTGTNCSHWLPALATSAKPLPDSSQIFTRAEKRASCSADDNGLLAGHLWSVLGSSQFFRETWQIEMPTEGFMLQGTKMSYSIKYWLCKHYNPLILARNTSWQRTRTNLMERYSRRRKLFAWWNERLVSFIWSYGPKCNSKKLSSVHWNFMSGPVA